MENAGKGVADDILGSFPELRRFAILCGKGNNGGDGFVLARWLKRYGKDVKVFVFSEEFSKDASLNYTIAKEHGVEIERFQEDLGCVDAVVDAIFGTGFRGKLEGLYEKAVSKANSMDAFRIALDIPSGVDGYTGKVEGVAFKADITYTFALPKLGHFLFEGKLHTGKLKVVDIGIETKLYEGKGFLAVEEEDLEQLMPKHMPWTHKGRKGSVLLVGGSGKFVGAPLLMAKGALLTGVGYVYLAVPESIHPYIAGKLPRVITIALPDKLGKLYKDSVSYLMNSINFENIGAIALGCGFGRSEDTESFVHEFLERTKDIPKVIDADGIWAIRSIHEKLPEHTVITPHPGEMSLLYGRGPAYIDRYRIDVALDFSKNFKGVLLLKGHPTVIVKGDDKYLNLTGDERTAMAGSGDILTGMIAGYIAQGTSPLQASVLSAYVHGKTAHSIL